MTRGDGRFAFRLEPILSGQVIDGREFVSPLDGPDTTFELVYAAGEVFFLVQGNSGLPMVRVLAALSGQVP